MNYRTFVLLLCTIAASMVTATAAPAPDTLLSETFDATADGKLPAGWEPVAGRWSVVQGRLRGEATDYLSKILLPVPAQQDVAIEADAAFESARDAGRWLALAVRNPNGAPAPHLQFTHRFDRSRPGGMEIGWFAAGQPKPAWSIYSVESLPLPPKAGETHRLRFETRGWCARGFVDGQLVMEQLLPADTLVAGPVALIVSGVTATFDDVRVFGLPPAEPGEAERLLSATCTSPLVIAHRGDSTYAPENTLAAIRRAIEVGADMVEVDVALSEDGVVVLMHDYSVERTTDGKGRVSDLTLAELKALDAGSWKDPKYAGERIPTLEEACQVAKGKVPLILDLKGSGYVPQIAEVVTRLGMADQVIAACWSQEQAASIRKLLPLVACKRLLSQRKQVQSADAAFLNAHVEAGIRGFSCASGIVTPDFIRTAHRRAMPVYVWTVNDPGMMERMVQLGLDGIYTDDPGALKRVIASIRQRTWIPAAASK